jgi:hypothetical protein
MQRVQGSDEQRAEAEKRRKAFEWWYSGWEAYMEGKPRVSPQSWPMEERKLFLKGYAAAEKLQASEDRP